MLHVVTVHFESHEWIEPQLRFLERHAPRETRVWACLNGIDRSWWSRFHFADDFDGYHPDKLNRLAAIVSEDAAPGDHLLFLDGDAFPIAPIAPLLADPLPLVAVRRDENLGDPQPHPCFAVTTVGFWNEIGGDWRPGFKWRNSEGHMVTDSGGNLLRTLRERGIEWRPLLRTNRVNLHPVWFALYGDVVYHHGAGFRDLRLSRVDILGKGLDPHAAADLARVPAGVPVLRRLERSIRRRRAIARRARWEEQERAEQSRLAREIFESILTDDDFYRRFL